MLSALCRTHIHPLLCRGTSSGPHIFTGLTLDEASSAALGRMIVGCPQLTVLCLTGTFESLRLCSRYVLQPCLCISVIFVFSLSRYDHSSISSFRFVTKRLIPA
jgi:hypothetical protein